tara:strand:+ start:584 stop:772 length:189 start_codon:yes stop_codon:yes gene_type:complete
MKANDKGYKDFTSGRIINPYNLNTYRHKEWERGFNKAYFEQLKKVKEYEARRRSKEVHGTQV